MSQFEIEGFRIDQTPIGEGCCGEVFRALDLESKKGYAAKRYRSMAVDRNLMAKLFDQFAGMPSHPGIIPLKAYQFDQTPYYTVVEFENGKPLYDCGFFDEVDCWELIRIMGAALGHAHKYGLKHGNLHPGNLFLLEHQDGTRQLRIGDFATGMMGQVHHVDLGETAYFAAPEQLLSLGVDFEGGKAERWDVYRFGAVAFWLLNRMLPRARGYRKARAQDIANSGGRPVPIDPFQLAESALDEDRLSWGRGVARGKKEKRYREIIESCLSLDPLDRPVDMREVDDAFRAVGDEFFFNETVEKANAALHDAENRVTRERLKQKAKLFTARATATILAASFMIATFYLLTYLKKTWESSNRIIELDQVVANQRAHISILGDKVEATVDDLRQSREAADASFYGLTQNVEGGQAEASLIKQLGKLRTYYLEILKEAAEREEAAAERGRALHSLALIEKRMSRNEEAVDHFAKAIATFEDLLEEPGSSVEKSRQDMMVRLADSYENVAILHEMPGDGQVIAALSRAVWYFKQVPLISPDDSTVTNRLADCSFRLGQILEDQNRFEAAIGSYSEAASRVVQLRNQTEDSGKIRHYDEMIARLQFHAATSLHRVGRIDEATESFIAAIESIENLREIEGYSLEQKLMKARSFLALGDIFSSEESIELGDKDQVYNEALRLIAPLNRDKPDDVEIAILMCHSLKRLAQLELEAEHWRDGYNLSVRGIETLNHALEKSDDHFLGYLELAETRLDHLRFLTNDTISARRISLRGVDNATRAHDLFLDAAPEMCDRKRERLAARLRGLFSSYQEACLKLGQRQAAEECSEYAAFKLSYQD